MCNETPARAVDLNATILEVEKVFRSVVGEEVLMRTRLEPSLGLIQLDPRKLESVLINLFMRARDVTANGGELMVTTSNIELDHAGAAENGVLPGFFAVIEVAVGASMDAPVAARDAIRQAPKFFVKGLAYAERS